jgi:hypothetical protein
MATLPQKLTLDLLQTQWAQQLNPVLANPQVLVSTIQNVALVTGTNTVNHKLGKKLQGWYLTRVRSSVMVYDQQDSNQIPQLTLVLIASGPAVVDIAVY